MESQEHTTILSTKGQVILPKAVREHLHWAPGTRLSVEHTAEGVLLRPKNAGFPSTRPEDVFGCLASPGSAKTIEDMDAGIAAELKRRHARGRY
jgi:AbrB family looped-hinge helix DNA binding protein